MNYLISTSEPQIRPGNALDVGPSSLSSTPTAIQAPKGHPATSPASPTMSSAAVAPYPSSVSPSDYIAPQRAPVNEQVVALAIAEVVEYAHRRGTSLAQLTAEVLAEDGFLDDRQRLWLSEIVADAWHRIAA